MSQGNIFGEWLSKAQADACVFPKCKQRLHGKKDVCKPHYDARRRLMHYYKHRANSLAVEYEPLDPVEIFKRDGWRCQICGRQTWGRFPAPRSPSLDHIIPMTHGGPHIKSNVQCTCWQCNARKGSGTSTDQLRLAI